LAELGVSDEPSTCRGYKQWQARLHESHRQASFHRNATGTADRHRCALGGIL